jgi:hypothetical protein
MAENTPQFASILEKFGFKKPDLHTALDKTQPKGPAIIYTAWNGASCGKEHDLNALLKASETLRIPLYVINSGEGNLEKDKPGTQLAGTSMNENIDILDRYRLSLQDKRVRLIAPDGSIAKTRDITSRENIVATFGPLVEQMRTPRTTPDRPR